MNKYMQEAVNEAKEGIENNHGGPFGSVIVLNNRIIGRGHNQVLLNNDCTCHGEIQAIRDACKNTSSYDLSDCELYTTAYPCPMCLGAILWSNIKSVYYGCNLEDTEEIGFRDDKFYNNLNFKPKSYIELDREQCKSLFSYYQTLNRNRY